MTENSAVFFRQKPETEFIRRTMAGFRVMVPKCLVYDQDKRHCVNRYRLDLCGRNLGNCLWAVNNNGELLEVRFAKEALNQSWQKLKEQCQR
ncbi:MAG TPA: hypothetical protein VF828_00340 [Patescibacteria group bacterium]